MLHHGRAAMTGGEKPIKLIEISTRSRRCVVRHRVPLRYRAERSREATAWHRLQLAAARREIVGLREI